MTSLEKSYQSNLNRELFALSLDPAARMSLQAQLLGALRRIILETADHAGCRLPASRSLAAELSVSRTTVQAVYDQLISEGYLIARQGSGTYIAKDITDLGELSARVCASAQPATPWQPFHLGLPDPVLMPYRQWARHLERSWRKPDPALLARPDPMGWYPLRSAICDHLAAWRKLSCRPEQVVITSGAWETVQIVCRGLLGGGARVVIEDPCWPKTHDALAAAGTLAVPVRIGDEGLEAGQIPEGTSAAIVTPSRHYPTGCSLPLPRRLALLDWAARNGGLIVEDDYDSEFRYRGQPLPSLAGLDELRNTIYVGSFSKLISPAVRIGYMVVPDAFVEKIRSYLRRVGSQASLVPQPALAGFMLSGEFGVHLRRMRRLYARRQAELLAALAPVGDLLELSPDAAGMHLCVPLRPDLSSRLTDQDIVRAGAQVGLDLGALSAHSVLPQKPQALLLGYAAFGADALSEAAQRLIGVLRGR